MKRFLSVIATLMMLMCVLATQISAATTIGRFNFEIVSENGMNVATAKMGAAWEFESTIGTISKDASYSDKTQYKFIINFSSDVSGDAGTALGFVGDFTLKSSGAVFNSSNPWKSSIWNVKNAGSLVLDGLVLIDNQADTTIPGGNGVVVESGGVLYLINGAAVRGFNYNVSEGVQVSPGSKTASIKVLNGGTLNLDSHAKQEPIYCEAGAVINLSSHVGNIQWKINGEIFNGTTYTATEAGYVTVDFDIACTDHDYVLSAQKANNCRNDGTNTYVCSICLDEKVDVVPADPDMHVWNDGVCSVCSTECAHSWGEWTMTGPSGYSENQWKDYSGHIRKSCFICSKQIDVEIPELQTKLLTGKNILMSGDSIISGYRVDIIQNFTGATVNRIGVSSATVSTGEGTNRLINQLIKDRANNPDAVYDVVFLFGGINDARCQTPIGQLSTDGSYDVDTFIGALEELIEYAKREYPNSEIAYIIPYKTTYAEDKYGGLIDHRDDYTNAIISVCEKWDVPYLDMYNSEMISGVLNGTYKITTTDVASGFNNLAQYDGLHPNYSGYYFMSVFVSQMAEKLILGEYQFDVIAEKIDATCAKDGSMLRYNFAIGALESEIIPATGLHTYVDDYNCETAHSCDVCGKGLIEAISHITAVTISYENGYDAVGANITYCTNEGCMHKVTVDTEALFTCLGYSAPENGNGGLAVGYLINYVAITEYENATGKTMKYGVFAVLMDRIGDREIFNTNGDTMAGAVNVEISKTEYSAFILKITGFSEDQKDTQIAMGAYTAVIEGATVKYSYLQPTAPENGKKYSSVSYNDVVKASAEE